MPEDRPKRIAAWKATAETAGAAVGLTVLLLISSVTTLDGLAEQRFQDLFQRSLATFALARALNGIISAVQGTELALQPAGVGVTFTPGEILDPVNDLVEWFSWIMLSASISLGIQQVLLEVGQWWVIRCLAVLIGVAWLVTWRTRRHRSPTRRGTFEIIWFRAFVVVLIIRFAIPVAFIINEGVYSHFLESRYLDGVAALETAGEALERSVPTHADSGKGESGGLGSMLDRAWDSAKDRLDLDERMEAIEQRAAEMVSHVVRLSVVFILQTALLPILFLWALVALARQLGGRHPLRNHSP